MSSRGDWTKDLEERTVKAFLNRQTMSGNALHCKWSKSREVSYTHCWRQKMGLDGTCELN